MDQIKKLAIGFKIRVIGVKKFTLDDLQSQKSRRLGKDDNIRPRDAENVLEGERDLDHIDVAAEPGSV